MDSLAYSFAVTQDAWKRAFYEFAQLWVTDYCTKLRRAEERVDEVSSVTSIKAEANVDFDGLLFSDKYDPKDPVGRFDPFEDM